MKFFSNNEKENMQDEYYSNPIFKVVSKAFNGITTELNTLNVSSEDIFANSLYIFDFFLFKPERRDLYTDNLWADTFTKFRDLAQKQDRFDATELKIFTGILLFTSAFLCRMTGIRQHKEYAYKILRQIENNNDDDVCMKYKVLLYNSISREAYIDIAQYVIKYAEKSLRVSNKIFQGKAIEKPKETEIDYKSRFTLKNEVVKIMSCLNGASSYGTKIIDTEGGFETICTALDNLILHNKIISLEKHIRLTQNFPKVVLTYVCSSVWKILKGYIDRDDYITCLSSTFSLFEGEEGRYYLERKLTTTPKYNEKWKKTWGIRGK